MVNLSAFREWHDLLIPLRRKTICKISFVAKNAIDLRLFQKGEWSKLNVIRYKQKGWLLLGTWYVSDFEIIKLFCVENENLAG